MNFVERALVCWRAASLALGWRPDEFWAATPAELAQSLPQPTSDEAIMSSEELRSLRSLFPDQGSQ